MTPGERAQGASGEPFHFARVRIVPQGNGWAIVARDWCYCGPTAHTITTRAVYAQTVAAAVWKFRIARREAQLADAGLQLARDVMPKERETTP